MTNTQINLNDITLVVNIIDVCSQRGAFKGDELAPIGTLRQKFAEIIKASQPQNTQTEPDTGTENTVDAA
jgi:hypothetical protein